MAFVNSIGTRFYLSKFPQSGYGAPVAVSPATLWHPFPSTERAITNYSVETANDKGFATGVSDDTDQWTIGHGATITLPFQLNSDWVGRLLRYARGTIATEQPDETNAPTVYRHSFARADFVTTPQLPVLTLYERIGTAHRYRYADMAVRRFGWEVSNTDRIRGSVELIGSGKRLSGGLTSEPAELTGLAYFYGSNVTAVIGDNVNADISLGLAKRLRNVNVAIVNTFDEEGARAPGSARFQTDNDVESGSVSSHLLLSDTAWEVSLTYLMEPDDPTWTWLQAQTVLDFEHELKGATIEDSFYHSVKLSFPRMRIQSVQPSNLNNLSALQVTARIQYDFTTAKDATVEVTNTVASYNPA